VPLVTATPLKEGPFEFLYKVGYGPPPFDYKKLNNLLSNSQTFPLNTISTVLYVGTMATTYTAIT